MLTVGLMTARHPHDVTKGQSMGYQVSDKVTDEITLFMEIISPKTTSYLASIDQSHESTAAGLSCSSPAYSQIPLR